MDCRRWDVGAKTGDWYPVEARGEGQPSVESTSLYCASRHCGGWQAMRGEGSIIEWWGLVMCGVGTGPVEARDVRPIYDHLGKV